MENTPRILKQSSKTIQRDIREIMANISRKRKQTLFRSKENGTITVTTEACELIASRTAAEIATPIPVQQPPNKPQNTIDDDDAKKANLYARTLFLRHTNVMDVCSQLLPQRSATTHRKVAIELYEDYVSKPRQDGYRKYLQSTRFDTRFNEGMLRTVLKVPITSAQEHIVYKRKLAEAGVTKMCYVDMTHNNLVLEHKEKVVKVLKEQFDDWPAKLRKLPKYITSSQRIREQEDRRFLRRLRKHSSLKGSYMLGVPDVVDELVREFRIPSEQRKNLTWLKLRFDSEDLNRQYSTGQYCRFQHDILDILSDDLMELPPRRTDALVQEESRAENVDSSAVQSAEVCPIEVTLPPEPTSESQPSNDRQSHQAFALPINRNLSTPCSVRARRISYDLDVSLDAVLNTNASIVTNNENNPSIAYVSIVQEKVNPQIKPLGQDYPVPNAESFTPLLTSTQEQSEANERQRVHAAEVPSSTLDPLQLTGAISTLSPFNACASGSSTTTNLLVETVSQNVRTQSQLQPSSTIPPFQMMNPSPRVSTPTIIVNSPTMKQEPLSERQLQDDFSEYEGYVEFVPNLPEVIVIDSDTSMEFALSVNGGKETVQMSIDQKEEFYLTCAEGTTMQENAQNVENETDQ